MRRRKASAPAAHCWAREAPREVVRAPHRLSPPGNCPRPGRSPPCSAVIDADLSGKPDTPRTKRSTSRAGPAILTVRAPCMLPRTLRGNRGSPRHIHPYTTLQRNTSCAPAPHAPPRDAPGHQGLPQTLHALLLDDPGTLARAHHRFQTRALQDLLETPRGARGCASWTRRIRPACVVPWRPTMAACAAWRSGIATEPRPGERPV